MNDASKQGNIEKYFQKISLQNNHRRSAGLSTSHRGHLIVSNTFQTTGISIINIFFGKKY